MGLASMPKCTLLHKDTQHTKGMEYTPRNVDRFVLWIEPELCKDMKQNETGITSYELIY